jgi:hypothetical protein
LLKNASRLFHMCTHRKTSEWAPAGHVACSPFWMEPCWKKKKKPLR